MNPARTVAGLVAAAALAVGYWLTVGAGDPISVELPVHDLLEQEPDAPAEAPQVEPADVEQALKQLEGLTIKGRAPKTGYDRSAFGNGWATVDGCDLRNRILARDLDTAAAQPGSDGCVIETGTLHDPYTGTSIEFTLGDTSNEVHIDHVVSLGDGWQKGAQFWAHEDRVRFANDPANLLAVAASANLAKGDADAATWLPPNKAFRCTFITIQVGIKHTYQLWVTPAEHDAMERILRRCEVLLQGRVAELEAPADVAAPPGSNASNSTSPSSTPAHRSPVHVGVDLDPRPDDTVIVTRPAAAGETAHD